MSAKKRKARRIAANIAELPDLPSQIRVKGVFMRCTIELKRDAGAMIGDWACRLSRFVVFRRVLRGLSARHFGAKNESPTVSEAERQECRSGATGYQRQGDGD